LDILLIQILRLGDALQMTPIIRGLKDSFPYAKIHVLTSTVGEKVFERQAEVDRVFVLHKQELVDLVRHSRIEDVVSALSLLQSDLKPILDRKWDWVINFSFSFPSAILAFLADGSHRSGFFVTKDRQYIFKEKWFAYSISSFVNRRYSVFNWVDIYKKIINIPSIPKKPAFILDLEEFQKAQNHLNQIGFAGRPILGIHPGASGNHKRWPIENFIKLGRSLVDKYNYKILVLGDRNENKLGEAIVKAVGPDVLDLTGQTTLSQLAAYISLCSVFVCNDSGPMHLASALNIPVIALFFSTHFVETGPYGKDNIVIHPDIPCFPCEGTASCISKECLKYIEPHTIERIIINRREIIENRRFDLDKDDGPISVNISGFDPWDNLEWVRVDNQPVQLDDILRLVFKVSWLFYLDGVDDHEEIDEYIKAVLKRLYIHRDNGNITRDLTLFIGDLERLQGALNEGYKLCFKIQSALLEPNIDSSKIQQIGRELQRQEEVILSFGENPWLSPFVEYFRLTLENIVEKEIFRLSKITIDLYKEMLTVTDAVKNLSEKYHTYLTGLKAN